MNNESTRLITGRVRLSYVHVFTPHASMPGAEPKFSVTLLIPKTDIATKQRVDAAIQAAIQKGVTERFNGVRPPMLSIPIHDGDGVKPSDGMPFPEECKGHWVMSASSKQRPEVVDISCSTIMNQSEVYSGMYARVSINFFPFSQAGKKGIGCGLGNVQKIEDGEPLGGRTSAASDFGAAPGFTPQQPAYNPQSYPQQPNYVPQPYVPQAPAYPQQPTYAPSTYAPQAQPQRPAYEPQPMQYDPITGAPIGGGVMGLDNNIPF